MSEYTTYLTEIQEISTSESSFNDKLFELKKLLERLSRELTSGESIQFPTLFSRLVFLAQKLRLSKQSEWQLQHLRVHAKEIRKKKEELTETEYRKHERALLNILQILSGNEIAPDENVLSEPFPAYNEKTLRVQIQHINREKSEIECLVEKHAGAAVTVKYNVKPDNDALNSSVEQFWVGAQLNLIDFSIDKNGALIPKFIVLEPDYLIDASAIADCFHDYCVTPMHYFRNKFETLENRSYLLLGNLANFFLDELIFAQNPEEVSFDETFLKSFRQSPFEYTSCQDIASGEDFRVFMQKARSQFENIRRVITEDFSMRDIDVRKCTLEPSFFSEKYGFQGRLDLLQINNNAYKIVELKSGKLPYPPYDSGKIALNHEVQTSVYRLMIESVFNAPSRKVEAAILYSSGSISGANLRFAAEFQQLEKEIVNARNHIVANEHMVMNGDNDTVAQLFQNLYDTTDIAQKTAKFYTQKIEDFKSVLRQCSPTELNYFYRYIRFISRELYLQKIGDIEYESPTGVASLWNSDFAERADALDVLFDLSIESIDDSGNDMKIVFRRNRAENDIVNFREGEICIVYPRQNENDTVLNRQILKGNIAAISREFIEIRFRNKQRNRAFFNENRRWAVEHDTLDTSYNSMYKGLFAFLKAPKQQRALLLGITEPGNAFGVPENMDYPENIVQKAMAAEDYFLIIGPPGTGKTSIFARRLIEEYYAKPTTNILVLAYTNRAVDELCEAINAAFGKNNNRFIRVGTELSCAEEYRNRLLQNISEKAKNRESLRQEIENTRIFVSTLASINGKLELFNLKKFDVAIIDEASQILEPQIIGLLPNFDKFIMIGDHNQLPAIVLQKNTASIIHEPPLTEIGITNCAHSLFERLLRNCTKNDWTHAYAQLTIQGRMHEHIAAFPSAYFYPQSLLPAQEWQSENWNSSFPQTEDIFLKSASKNRITFFSTEQLISSKISTKTNENEATIVVEIVKSIAKTYAHDKRYFNTRNIGIITPYRNQIALIKHKLAEANIADYENIMVDTVERFQGSQRDVIIISFCVNKPYQLNFLCNLNDDGTVDRKLNVSLTRARQQLFMVGNREILRKHPIYATLMEFLKEKTVVIENTSIIRLK
ncbi:MAG: AAA domain-containing protein [Bacteroidia bacterium]|nr:AAA domain-containing protein [Bacteroidia bacterium]